MVVDFAMNAVCAADTGSFLDRQASRLNLKVEEFGMPALQSKKPVHIGGRCTVFAESDMVHKQQMGYEIKDIIYGLCQPVVVQPFERWKSHASSFECQSMSCPLRCGAVITRWGDDSPPVWALRPVGKD